MWTLSDTGHSLIEWTKTWEIETWNLRKSKCTIYCRCFSFSIWWYQNEHRVENRYMAYTLREKIKWGREMLVLLSVTWITKLYAKDHSRCSLSYFSSLLNIIDARLTTGGGNVKRKQQSRKEKRKSKHRTTQSISVADTLQNSYFSLCYLKKNMCFFTKSYPHIIPPLFLIHSNSWAGGIGSHSSRLYTSLFEMLVSRELGLSLDSW